MAIVYTPGWYLGGMDGLLNCALRVENRGLFDKQMLLWYNINTETDLKSKKYHAFIFTEINNQGLAR